MSVPENQQQYGSILTVLGENAEQNGKLQNKQISFTHIAIGDANDTYVQPDRTQKSLVNELVRIPVNSVDVLQPTPSSVPMLKVEAILPDNVNNIVIREFAAVAIFNGSEYFHAIGNCARIYVPPPINNGNVSLPVTLEMIFVITSKEPIVEIDPNVVTASRQWVGDHFLDKGEKENLAPSDSEVIDFNYPMIYRSLSDYDLSDTTVWGFAHTGQSLAEGGVGGDAVAGMHPPLYPDKMLMFNAGPVGLGAKELGVSLVPLEEHGRVTIGTSFLRKTAEQQTGNFEAVFHGQAFGGQNYQALKKGGYTKVFEKVLAQVREAFSLRETIQYQAVSCIHGEQDGLDGNANYAQNLIEWQSDFEQDIQQITGQTDSVGLFVCQTSTAGGYGHNGGINETTFPTPLEQLKAHRASDKIHLVCPKYFVPYYDHSHITNNAQRVIGEYYQKAFSTIKSGGVWNPLMPSSVIGNGNEVTISFVGHVGGLVFDTTLVKSVDNYGFDYRDDAGNTITDVSINGSNQVVILLSGPVGANAAVSYAYHNGAGGKNNQINGLGDRGNLRDSDTALSAYDGSERLYNWCVTFKELLA